MEELETFIQDYIDSYNENDVFWMDRAACRKVTPLDLSAARTRIAISDSKRRGGRVEAITKPTDLFYPPEQKKDKQRIKEAVEICARCEVKNNCLAAGIVNEERFGVWGGKMPKELRQLENKIREWRMKKCD